MLRLAVLSKSVLNGLAKTDVVCSCRKMRISRLKIIATEKKIEIKICSFKYYYYGKKNKTYILKGLLSNL